MNPTDHMPRARHSESDTEPQGVLDLLFDERRGLEPWALELIRELCGALAAEGIVYCHWKSNNALDRSASGDNDLDLLVRRSDVQRFTEILYGLGFRRATATATKRMPGVQDYFGYDEASGRLVHVHAHYQLVLGHDSTKNYRLPIEEPYLESVTDGSLFRVPAPELEFIVFVIRMILKHCTWEVILGGEGQLKAAELDELAYLRDRIDRERVADLVVEHLPFVGAGLFSQCVAALDPGCGVRARMRTGRRLQAALRGAARRRVVVDTYLKLWRRALLSIRRRVFKYKPRYRLESGGALIAIIGGDGAGKSTAVNGLRAWLSTYFEATSVHVGKPAWSWTTKTVRGILKIGHVAGLYPQDSSLRKTVVQESLVSPGYPWLLREVCRARDRYRTYLEARRFAGRGGLVIVDRFPVSQIKLMDGPQAERFLKELAEGPRGTQIASPTRASPVARALIRLEERYYRRTVAPDLLAVLRVDPDIAVRRKTDEDAATVRERSSEVWGIDWAGSGAHVVDASKPREEVLAELKSLVWSEL